MNPKHSKWKSKNYDWESYDEKYHSYIMEYLYDFGPKWMMDLMPQKIYEDYINTFGTALTKDSFTGLATEQYYKLEYMIIEDIQEE